MSQKNNFDFLPSESLSKSDHLYPFLLLLLFETGNFLCKSLFTVLLVVDVFESLFIVNLLLVEFDEVLLLLLLFDLCVASLSALFITIVFLG
ncbi:MAG: hypothetical protein Q8S84_05165 [bacterium]|nr:hypothetical protein [bacterium]